MTTAIEREARTARGRSLAGLVAVGAGLAAATLATHGTRGRLGFDACPLHALTGWSCPFCGGMRAVAALTDGDLPAALSYNLVVVVLVVAATSYLARQVVVAVRGGTPAFPTLTSRQLMVASTVCLVFAVWRNIPALPLAGYLAP